MTRKKTIIIILSLIIVAILLAYVVFSILMSNPTTLYLDPQTTEKAVGQDFVVNASVSNVVDLYGWELYLSWNKTILDVVNVTQGPFLESGGNSPFISPTIWNENGSLLLDGLLTGNVTGVDGSGVLATIRFQVIGSGKSDLLLYGTTLVSSSQKSIAHTVKSGTFST